MPAVALKRLNADKLTDSQDDDVLRSELQLAQTEGVFDQE
jgi:hypothetical protein